MYIELLYSGLIDECCNLHHIQTTAPIFFSVVQQLSTGLGRLFVETHTHTHTPGRTPLNERSATRTDRYLYTTHNKHKGCTSMPLVGFETTTPAIEWLQTYVLECTATGIGQYAY
jgi:hypothetical protein